MDIARQIQLRKRCDADPDDPLKRDVSDLLDALGLLRAKLGLLRQFALYELNHWEGRNADRMYEAKRFLSEIDK